MKLRHEPALFRLARHKNRAAFSAFKETFKRSQVKGAIFLGSAVALQTVLFQERSNLIKLSGLTCQWQESEDQKAYQVVLQCPETIANHLDGAIGEIPGTCGLYKENEASPGNPLIMLGSV
jgi:hypothetical protein